LAVTEGNGVEGVADTGVAEPTCAVGTDGAETGAIDTTVGASSFDEGLGWTNGTLANAALTRSVVVAATVGPAELGVDVVGAGGATAVGAVVCAMDASVHNELKAIASAERLNVIVVFLY
jgi:hypothetical protein